MNLQTSEQIMHLLGMKKLTVKEVKLRPDWTQLKQQINKAIELLGKDFPISPVGIREEADEFILVIDQQDRQRITFHEDRHGTVAVANEKIRPAESELPKQITLEEAKKYKSFAGFELMLDQFMKGMREDFQKEHPEFEEYPIECIESKYGYIIYAEKRILMEVRMFVMFNRIFFDAVRLEPKED